VGCQSSHVLKWPVFLKAVKLGELSFLHDQNPLQLWPWPRPLFEKRTTYPPPTASDESRSLLTQCLALMLLFNSLAENYPFLGRILSAATSIARGAETVGCCGGSTEPLPISRGMLEIVVDVLCSKHCWTYKRSFASFKARFLVLVICPFFTT
jgi:hypothetical protein